MHRETSAQSTCMHGLLLLLYTPIIICKTEAPEVHTEASNIDASGDKELSREKTRFVHIMQEEWRTCIPETESVSQCVPCT